MNEHTFIGLISIGFIIVETIFILGYNFKFGAVDIVFFFAFIYMAYNTLVKKEKLTTKKAWIGLVIIIVAFFIFSMIIRPWLYG
jgi:hypothetical protein